MFIYHQKESSLDFTIPVAIPINEEKEIKNTLKVHSLDPEYSSIFELKYNSIYSSGVVIALRDTPITIGKKNYCALALTAGHLIGKAFRPKIRSLKDVKGYAIVK